MAKGILKNLLSDKIDTYPDTHYINLIFCGYENYNLIKGILYQLIKPFIPKLHEKEDVDLCVDYLIYEFVREKSRTDFEKIRVVQELFVFTNEKKEEIEYFLKPRLIKKELLRNNKLVFTNKYSNILKFYMLASKIMKTKVKKRVDDILDQCKLPLLKTTKKGKAYSFDSPLFELLFENNQDYFQIHVNLLATKIKESMMEVKKGRKIITEDSINYAHLSIFNSELNQEPDPKFEISKVKEVAIYFFSIKLNVPYHSLRDFYYESSG